MADTMAYLDFSRMKPVHGGVHRDGLFGLQPNFIGGRRDGQSAPAGWCSAFCDEYGHPQDHRPPTGQPNYRLFVNDNGYQYHYIHSAYLADYQEPASE
ncbi:MAG: hypothetical protein ACRDRF_00150 [Pseudonocardiaceae bacterium]